MAHLILVRHGESAWNEKGLWTGWADIGLNEKGKEEAKKAGESLKEYGINAAYTSALLRAHQTLDEILKILNLNDIPVIKNKALNERDYGIYTGKNKWEVEKEVGDEKFFQIRRGWDTPIQNGESLKDVYNRVIPYYQKEILPKLIDGKNILISAHGNSLRALIKYLDNISDKDVENLEIATGEVDVFEIDPNGSVTSKKVLLS